ncbi:MAG TPA: DUF898 family protein [Bacteroidia bacterium]|jgi:uncharacterized membrane protein YjgN (DUF898 family)|nr:DUF898 family protein [Bacteroidia bacterium]
MNNPENSANTNTPVSTFKYPLSYEGTGGEYLGILLLNFLLTAITFGLYHPWAKARRLQFLYSSTEFAKSRFSFVGTGNEMFKGFIKAIGLFVLIYLLLLFFVVVLHMPQLGVLLFYAGFLGIIPLAIHGTYKYRMARTFWRGIRLGYHGKLGELYSIFLKGFLFTILTLGFYAAWLSMNVRNYIFSHLRFGNLKFKYEGDGADYFFLNLKGYFLTIFTLGIYAFWWWRDQVNYLVDNLSAESEKGEKLTFKSNVTGGGLFKLMIVNLLLIIVTLGFGYAWVITRTLNYVFMNIEIEGTVDFDKLIQTEGNFGDATGDDLASMLDIGVVI